MSKTYLSEEDCDNIYITLEEFVEENLDDMTDEDIKAMDMIDESEGLVFDVSDENVRRFVRTAMIYSQTRRELTGTNTPGSQVTHEVLLQKIGV
jgi:hypothetical protein